MQQLWKNIKLHQTYQPAPGCRKHNSNGQSSDQKETTLSQVQPGSNLQNRRRRSIDAMLLPCGSLRHGFRQNFRRRPNKLKILRWQHFKNWVLRRAANGNLICLQMCLQRLRQPCHFQCCNGRFAARAQPQSKPSPPAHACAACHPAGMSTHVCWFNESDGSNAQSMIICKSRFCLPLPIIVN